MNAKNCLFISFFFFFLVVKWLKTKTIVTPLQLMILIVREL